MTIISRNLHFALRHACAAQEILGHPIFLWDDERSHCQPWWNDLMTEMNYSQSEEG